MRRDMVIDAAAAPVDDDDDVDDVEVVNMATLTRSVSESSASVAAVAAVAADDDVSGDSTPLGDSTQQCVHERRNVHITREAEWRAAKDIDKSVEQLVGPSGKGVVYVIGTAHVSTKSVETVRQLVSELVPDCVMVELCEKRRGMLHHGKQKQKKILKHSSSSSSSSTCDGPPEQTTETSSSSSSSSLPIESTESINNMSAESSQDKHELPTFTQVVSEYYRRRLNNEVSVTLFAQLYSWVLAHISKELGVVPGEEFRCAVDEANKIGAEVVLGDRDVKITLQRTMNSLTLYEKLKFAYMLVVEGFSMSASQLKLEIEKLVDSDDKDLVTEMLIEFPNVIEPLVYERDKYMCKILRDLTYSYPVTLAVVGKGHVEGIKSHWHEEIDIETLTKPLLTNTRLHNDNRHQVKWICLSIGIGVATILCIRGVMMYSRRR